MSAALASLRIGVCVLVIVAAPLALSLTPREGAPVLVFGSAAADAIVRADGLIVDAWSGGLVARSETPGFAARLWSAGAWIVLDASGRAGCASPDLRRS